MSVTTDYLNEISDRNKSNFKSFAPNQETNPNFLCPIAALNTRDGEIVAITLKIL